MLEAILNEDPPFFMDEDFSLPPPDEVTIKRILREISVIEDCLPRLMPNSETYINALEVGDSEDRIFITTIKKHRFPQGLEIFKNDSVERRENGLVARYVIYMTETEYREVYFDIYIDSIKRGSRDVPQTNMHDFPTREMGDIYVYEWLLREAKRNADREREAVEYANTTGMDFVSNRTFEKILEIVRFYRLGLCNT